MRKCRKIAVMKVSRQVAGVRTRARAMAFAAAAAEVGVSSKSRKAEAKAGGQLEMAYLQLRSRSLVMTQRLSKSARNSWRKGFGNVEQIGISRCSSIASSEAVEEENLRLSYSGGRKIICGDELRSSVCCFESNRDSWREITQSSNHVIYNSGELELELDSAVERKYRQSTPLSPITAAEIDEFFVAAEKSEKQRFASMYNFDIDNEIPLDQGRYEWVRISFDR